MSLLAPTQVESWLGLSSPTADDSFVVGIIMASVDAMFRDFLGFTPAQQTFTEYYPPRVNLTQRDQFVDGWERSGTSNKVVPIDRYRNERRAIILRNLPVRSITSVYENPDAWLSAPPSFTAVNLLQPGNDYFLDQEDTTGISKTGFLIRQTGPWTVAERCVQVTYVAGYTPAEIAGLYGTFQHAYLQQCQLEYIGNHRFRTGGQLGSQPGILTSESLGDYSVGYDVEGARKLFGMGSKLAPSVAQKLEPYVNWAMFF